MAMLEFTTNLRDFNFKMRY